jgi:ribonuclease III
MGDAVLNCVIAADLYARFPEVPESDLHLIRAQLVNGVALARLARALDVGAALRFSGATRTSGGADRDSIVADALEALFGAVFLDGGFDAARAVITGVYAAELAAASPATLAKDPKTRLQELLQGRRMPLPAYAVVETAGEAHGRTFTVECRVPALAVAASGTGPSRRAAEQAAAAVVYERIAATAAAGGKRD